MKVTLAGLAALGLILLFFLRGWSRGVVREILSLVGIAVIGVCVWYVTPRVSVFFRDNTQLYPWIERGCGQVVEKAAQELGASTVDSLAQSQVVQTLPVPELMRQEILEQSSSALGGGGYLDAITSFLAEKVYGAACVLISCLLGSLVMGILSSILGGFAKLPGIREVNSLAGALLGALKGALVVWLCLLILTVAWGTEWGQRGLSMVSEDTFLSWMMEYTISPLDQLGANLGGGS